MKEKEGLLEVLARKAGYLYLSDLHNPMRYKSIVKAIDEIEVGCYEEREWQEAFNYIHGAGLNRGSEQEIRKMFKKKIGQNY